MNSTHFQKTQLYGQTKYLNDLFNNTETHGYEQWHRRSIYHLTRQGQLILNWTLSTPKKLNESLPFPWYQCIVFTFLKITFTCHRKMLSLFSIVFENYFHFFIRKTLWKSLLLFFLFCFKITFPFHSDKCFIDHFHFSPFSLKITFIFVQKKAL